jgi:NADPH:quinone reductase
MKIIRMYEYGGPEVLKVEETDPLKPKLGEVLIKTEAIGVNYTDISRRRNATRELTPLPYTPGVEVAGTVVEVGEGVTGVSNGSQVIALVPHGGYAEYLTVPAAVAFPVPAGMDAVDAAALPLQGITAYQIISTFGRLQPGERIFIQAAAGGVGTMAVQLARALGAGQIIASASTQEKLDLALSLGADVGINYTQTGWIDRVMEETDGKGVNLLLEMKGGSTFSENFAYLAPMGRIVMFGAISGQRGIVDSEKLTSRCHTVTGYYSGFIGTRPDLFVQDLSDLFRRVSSGQVRPIVNHLYPLEEAAQAHRLMETRQTTGKIILLPTSR